MYLAWTSFLSLYHFAWIVVEIYWTSSDNIGAGEAFTFLTNQAYYLLVACQWLDCLMTILSYSSRKEIYEGKKPHIQLIRLGFKGGGREY